MLLAVGLIIFAFESYLPRPLPWIKPGLSNVVGVLALYWFGFPAAVLITFLRIFLGALFLGTLFNPVFLLSLGGGLAAILAMGIVFRSGKKYFSPIGISVVGAFFHMLTQLVLATLILIHRLELLQFLPFMLFSAVIAGVVVGLLARILIEKLQFIAQPEAT
jgi:heptaprenyl diphosphate synthase